LRISNFCRALKNDKGFTLVELMVVLVIIGILVAIAVPIYNKTQATAEERACQANLRILEGAVAQYQLDNDGALPTGLGDLSDYIKDADNLECPSGGTYEFEAGKFTCDEHPKTDSGGGTSGEDEIN
jgi:prepilin-type N-terminal cleavage/methylation domain-containing protein